MSRDELRRCPVEELIEHARGGDEGALEELFRRSQPMLKKLRTERLARARPDGAGPSDIAQETARRALEGLPSFKGTTEGEWSSYLRTIFLRCLKELHRNAGRQKRRGKGGATLSLESSAGAEVERVPAPGKSPSQAASHNEERRRLLISLHQLPPEQGEAIWLHELRETPVSEVARTLQKSRGSTIRALASGLKGLQMIMTRDPAVDPEEAPLTTGISADMLAGLSSYLSRRDAGEQIDRESFVAEHPGCADELRSLLEWIERIETIWGRSRGSQ